MSKMSKKMDEQLAAKAKKQKMILIGGAVLLVAVGAFQVPKLMGGGAKTEAVPEASDGSGSTAAPATAPAAAAPAVSPAASEKPRPPTSEAA